MTNETRRRSLSTISAEIAEAWPHPNPYAAALLDCMAEVSNMSETYYSDTADAVVARFLANAGTWHGDVARRVKAELRTMLLECG